MTWEWVYDGAGNILSKTEYNHTTGTLDTVTYTYSNPDIPNNPNNPNWRDLLIEYDGVEIEYDAIGNPLSYGAWTYTWEYGRQLASMSKGSTTWTFTYDVNGMRTGRSNGSVTYTYLYNGSQLTHMMHDDIEVHFSYGTDGRPLAIRYDDTSYYYITNLQGDVVAIMDSYGTTVVNYAYDAWGRVTITNDVSYINLGEINPLRYRGYIYDQETGLYYLQSRYYNPTWGRFLNADAFVSTGQGMLGNNMFAYCGNNPVMYSDTTGMAPEWWQWAVSGAMVIAGVTLVALGISGVAGGALICAGANSIINSYVTEASGGSSIAGWVGGAITGLICGAGAGFGGELLIAATNINGIACLGNVAMGLGAAFATGTGGSLAGQYATAAMDKSEIDEKEVWTSALVTGSVNMLAAGGAGMGNALQGLPEFTTTSTATANALNTMWGVCTEAICDAISFIISLFN